MQRLMFTTPHHNSSPTVLRQNSKVILLVIVLAQFFCTSVWFAGNSVITELVRELNIETSFLADITSAIQFGFISGTLVFAILTIADRFAPSTVFFISAIFVTGFNCAMLIPGVDATSLLISRFLTGFFLAGIYPVGMKIASDHFKETLGKSLGFLVGALVLGTAFPHLVKSITANISWQTVVYATSALSLLGGILVFLLIPDGRYRKTAKKMQPAAFIKGFKTPAFRSVAFGYFGHMWELYTFWTFVPVMLTARNVMFVDHHLNVPLLSFLIIASGSVACVVSGVLSKYFDAKKIATVCLLCSCLCCLLSPLLLFIGSTTLFLLFVFLWGLVVIADSPLFSTLVAKNVAEENRGTSLTIVNCIGFAITIFSIQFTRIISETIDPRFIYVFLAAGPLVGLIFLLKNRAVTDDRSS